MVFTPVVISPATVPPAHSLSALTPFCTARAFSNHEGAGTPAVDCYARAGTALFQATGNPAFASMTDSQAQSHAAHPEKVAMPAGAASAAGNTLIGIQFMDWKYNNESPPGTPSLYIYGSNGPCTASNYYVFATEPAGWNDVVSSAFSVASGGCSVFVNFGDANFQGRWVNCGTSVQGCYTSMVPDFNDVTSSFWLTH